MNQEPLISFQSLAARIRESDNSSFYNGHWGAYADKDVGELPIMTVEMLAQTPLPKRRYKESRGLTKIVSGHAQPFLVEFSLDDIRSEDYGTLGERPMVALADAHDALEKTLWFYEHDRLPLIGEMQNPPIAAFTAKEYGIDLMLADHHSAMTLFPILEKEYGITCTPRITFLTDNVDLTSVSDMQAHCDELDIIFGRPECGALARLCPEAHGKRVLLFHPTYNTHLEIDPDGKIIVTKLAFFSTPIIRYDTGRRGAWAEEKCACKAKTFAFT